MKYVIICAAVACIGLFMMLFSGYISIRAEEKREQRAAEVFGCISGICLLITVLSVNGIFAAIIVWAWKS